MSYPRGRIGDMIGKLHSVVLDAPDIKALSSFYGELAGLEQTYTDDEWIMMKGPEGWLLGFQRIDEHVPPRWPDPAYPQQFHLDWLVPDLDAGVSRAESLGATRLGGDGKSWVVLADPAGHPFCLCQGETGDPVKLADVAIDCPDGSSLARFYAELLGLGVTYEGAEGAAAGADGKLTVMFQQIKTYNAPRWPDPAYPQQFHLDVEVADIDEAEPKTLALGATRLPGGGKTFRVYADPAGHPFCLVW
jgi:catechol-2,3-dioxygenase